MKLSKYDDKLVEIVTTEDELFEGICSYDSDEYNEIECGRNEESLDILCLKFYKSDIKKVSIIDKFSSDYGLFEEVVSNDGTDLIEEVFDREEDIHIYRELLYLKDHKECVNDEVIELIKKLIKYNENEDIRREGNNIIGGSL